MLRISIARLPMGLVPLWRRWRSCLQVGPRPWPSCLQASPRPVVESQTCFRVNCVVIFLLPSNCCPFRSLICWLRGLVLYSSWVLVTQSFAFSFRLSKVGSFLSGGWSTSVFNMRIQCFEFWFFSFCTDVDVLLQGDSVVQQYVFFFPPDGIQRVSVWLTGVPSLSLGGVRAFADVLHSASVSPGSTFFVVRKVRARLHHCCSAWSHIQGLRWRHGCSGRTPLDSVRISYFFHSCNGLYQNFQ